MPPAKPLGRNLPAGLAPLPGSLGDFGLNWAAQQNLWGDLSPRISSFASFASRAPVHLRGSLYLQNWLFEAVQFKGSSQRDPASQGGRGVVALPLLSPPFIIFQFKSEKFRISRKSQIQILYWSLDPHPAPRNQIFFWGGGGRLSIDLNKTILRGKNAYHQCIIVSSLAVDIHFALLQHTSD